MEHLQNLAQQDNEIFSTIEEELNRQQNQIELIASENIVSRAVLEAQGSILTNKYAEGYPSHRYYGGCEIIDKIETLAIERAKKLFNCAYVNVQPHSGSQANMAVYFALLKPYDTIMGMSLDCGGHLTHGSSVSMSGKWLNAIAYGVDKESGIIDYNQVEELAKQYQPKIIIAGGSAYARKIDFFRFRKIADMVGAYLMVDMAHFAGLVAGRMLENPLQYADVVTTTTHKTLRGPRGGMILSNREDIARKINSAIFPGIQGGPLEHVIAAKAVCFGEALMPSFKNYAASVIENAQVMAKTLQSRGLNLVSGGTDTHLVLVDLRKQKLTGNVVALALERANITCNKNSIPFDPESPKTTSGIRLGTPAGTTRGFGAKEFEQISNWIADIIDSLVSRALESKIPEIKKSVIELCAKFPIYK